jgi:hypothetical protein
MVKKGNGFVLESKKMVKIRRKLEAQMASLDGKITVDSLNRMKEEIAEWIGRHGSHRTNLVNKSLALFDGNQNPKKPSSAIVKLYKQLQSDYHE